MEAALTIDSLQDSLLAHCLSFLDADDLLRAEASCRAFKRAIEGHRLWAAKAATAVPELAHLIPGMDTSDLEGIPTYLASPEAGITSHDAAMRRLSAGCKRLFSSAAAAAEPEACSLISAAVASTSTDHPQEGVESMLYPVVRTQRLTCYWSSSGTPAVDSAEQVAFRLVHPLCLVTAVQLRPFRAFFQVGHPIYAPQRVSVGMGGLPFTALWLGPAPAAEDVRARTNSRTFPRPPGQPRLHLGATEAADLAGNAPPPPPPPPGQPRHTWRDWMTLTPEFPVAQEDRLQTVALPRRELAVGGYLHLNLLGRTQRQDADGLYYTCLGYVRAVGRPLYHFSVVSESQPGCVRDAPPVAAALDERVRLKLHARELIKLLGGIAHVSEYGRRRAGGMFAGDESEDDAQPSDEELEWEEDAEEQEEPEDGPPTPPGDPNIWGSSSDEDDSAHILSDIVAAMILLKREFPKVDGVPPFATKAQLYTVLRDRTMADRELDTLKHSNTIRCFKLPSGPEEYAIMLTDDYAVAVAACRQDAVATGKAPALVAVFDWFLDRVLPACCEPTVLHDELVDLLATPRGGTSSRIPRNKVTEAHVSLLLQACCLTRHHGAGGTALAGQGAYLFSMPGAGPAVRGVGAGRKEIIDALSRRKHPEMLAAALAKRKLRGSPLGVSWHLRDLLGAGAVVQINTTVGTLIRVAKRG